MTQICIRRTKEVLALRLVVIRVSNPYNRRCKIPRGTTSSLFHLYVLPIASKAANPSQGGHDHRPRCAESEGEGKFTGVKPNLMYTKDLAGTLRRC